MITLSDVKDLSWTERHLARLMSLRAVVGGPGANTPGTSSKLARLRKAVSYLHSRRHR